MNVGVETSTTDELSCNSLFVTGLYNTDESTDEMMSAHPPHQLLLRPAPARAARAWPAY